MNLVVGATGQLGTAVVRKLQEEQKPVRAFVREDSHYHHLRDHANSTGTEIAFGDLRVLSTVEAAMQGVDTVLATANAIIPRHGERDEEERWYNNLLVAARAAGVKHFIFISVPVTEHDDSVPSFHHKRVIEEKIKASGISYTILRAAPFMDLWFAFMGSMIPLHGSEANLLNRQNWLMQFNAKTMGHSIENRGRAMIPGDGRARNTFITVRDAAAFMVRSIGNPLAINQTLEIGGPEALDFEQVADIFSKVMEKPLKRSHTPAGFFKLQQKVWKPLSPAASNIMGLNYIGATSSAVYDSRHLAEQFGIQLTTAEDFLREKMKVAE